MTLNADLYNAIKAVSDSVIKNYSLCDWQIGTYNNGKIKLDQKLNLSDKQYIKFKDMEIQSGDKVILLRKSGGQKYLVLGVIE